MTSAHEKQAVYKDKNGLIIKAGDRLHYREGHMEEPDTHLVIDVGGDLCGQVIMNAMGCQVIDDKPISLRFYQRTYANDGVCYEAEKVKED